MELLNLVPAVKSGKSRGLTELLAVAGMLAVAPAAWRAVEPVVLLLLEILLEIAQAGLAFLRANGV